MPLFTSPEAPSTMQVTVTAGVDEPISVTLVLLNEAGRPVPNSRVSTTITQDCALVAKLVEDFVCGWEAGAPTPYVVNGVARVLRSRKTAYDRR